MSICRFIYNNFITSESMLGVSSLRNGTVTSAKKEGTGSAVITTSGNYTGAADLEYIVEIDSIAGGAEVGQATFRWSDGGGTWDASGVTTSAVAILLNNGAYIAHTTGAGADFVVGDAWYFKGINLFNPGKMIDNDRDHSCRTAALGAPNRTTITFGSALTPTVLVIYDHNLTSAATITLQDSTGTLSESVTWASGKIVHYIAAPAAYTVWYLDITDAGNTDLYIDIGELFLGDYMELSRNYTEGFRKGFALLADRNKTPYGVTKKRFYNRQRTFKFDFNCIVLADMGLLEAMIDALAVRSTGVLKSFWFNDDSAIVGNTWLVDISAIPEDHKTRGLYATSLQLTEVMRSV